MTIDYLANADQLQIKIAQGAKPGEGGQLPGHKVDAYIAQLRHSTPGVGLISPPPHHDIYSIEDLKQLIYDLRCANPTASVSVKLVAEVGVGTVAAGVAKANADHVLIAGHDGGTGASPLSSIHGAGIPWEIGLAETQQTLLGNDLRSRIAVQTDGQMKTGRDVVIGALLGADEIGFSTAPLIATGCIMMRVCHLNTCPVGIATQDPELRTRFRGKPEHVVNYFVTSPRRCARSWPRSASRRFDDLIGRTELLRTDPADRGRQGRQRRPLARARVPRRARRRRAAFRRRHPTTRSATARLGADRAGRIRRSRTAGRSRSNPRSATSTARSAACSRTRSPSATAPTACPRTRSTSSSPARPASPSAPGSPPGSASRSTATPTTTPARASPAASRRSPAGRRRFAAEENVIVGNTVLYGATSGKAFFRGLAGERFAVRNSGAIAVVEGVGDHGCEYMTGGRVVVLGPTGATSPPA